MLKELNFRSARMKSQTSKIFWKLHFLVETFQSRKRHVYRRLCGQLDIGPLIMLFFSALCKVGKLPMVLASARLLQPQIQTPRDRRKVISRSTYHYYYYCYYYHLYHKGWIGHFGPFFFFEFLEREDSKMYFCYNFCEKVISEANL